MKMDKHICGTCGSAYTTIEDFILHKRSNCSVVSSTPQVAQTIGLKLSSSTVPKAISSQGQSRQQDGNQGVTLTANLQTSQEVLDGSCGSGREPEGTGRKKGLKNRNVETTPRETQSKNAVGKGKSSRYVKRFKCDFEECKFATAYQKDLRRHQRIHTGEKPFPCQFCEKRFSRDDKRRIHERIHTKEKPYACELCPYRCGDGGSLTKHMRVHSGSRPYQCQLCSYASRNSSSLAVHLRWHTGDSPFHCQHCDAKFKTNTDLKRHMLLHKGIKPFACDQCSYRAHAKSNLKSHIQHNHNGSKPFACDQCSYRAHTKSNLKSHIQHNHKGKAKYKCSACQFQCKTQKKMDKHYSCEHGNACDVSSTTSSINTATDVVDLDKNKCKENRKRYSCDYCSYTAKNLSILHMHTKQKHHEKEKPEESSSATTSMKGRKKLRKSKKGARKRTRSSKAAVPVFGGKRPWSCKDCDASFVREDSYRSHRRQHKQLQENTKSDATCSVPQNTSQSLENSDNALAIAVDTDCQAVTVINGSKHAGRCEGTSFRNGASQVGALDHQNNESPQGPNSANHTYPSGTSSMDAFSSTEAPSSGAEVCVPGNTSLSDSAHDLQIDPATSTLPDSSGPHAAACLRELITMMPININRGSSAPMMPPEKIVTQDSEMCIQEVVGIGQRQQEEAIQTQTLGYGTPNVPVLLSSVSHSPTCTLTTAAVPSARPSCQTVVSNAMKTAQNQCNVIGSVGVGITQPSNVNYVTLSNVGKGTGSIPAHVVNVNCSQAVQPPLAQGMVQQVASEQQQQQIILGDQNCFGSVNIATNNNAVTANPASLTVSNLGVSVSNSITGTQPLAQITAQAMSGSVPTTAFVWTGRELSQVIPGETSTSEALIYPKVPQ